MSAEDFLNNRIMHLEHKNARLRLVLTMVMGSEQMDANGHNWRTCNNPSCAAARTELSHNESPLTNENSGKN